MESAHSFLKLDSASSVLYLSSLASAMAQEGIIPEHVVDEFKRTVTILAPKLTNIDRTFLSLLWDYDPTFINILMTRYGTSGFAWNHFRLSTKAALSENNAALAHFANQILSKSNLFMNRAFVAKTSSNQSKRELFPAVLLHLSKCIHHSISALSTVIHSLSLMRPAEILDVSGTQHDIETRIALNIGFNGLESEVLTYCRTECRALQTISSTFEELAVNLSTIFGGLTDNIPQTTSSKNLDILCEHLVSQCLKLAGLKINMTHNLTVWETRRIAFLSELNALNGLIAAVSHAFSENITPKDHLGTENLITSDVEAAIACFILNQGHNLKLAQDASLHLIQYCNRHHVNFEQVLPGELKKIHPTLNADVLSFAITLTTENPMFTPGGSKGKYRYLDQANELKKSLDFLVPLTGMMLIPLFLLISSCGVKTSIASELKDPRPEIIFKNVEDVPDQNTTGSGRSSHTSKQFKEIAE
jgi:hypothetical protein